MRNEFTSIIERDGEWFVGYCPEIPGANGQGKTADECRANLAAAIALSPRRSIDRGKGNRRSFVKQRELLRHLRQFGCYLKRQGKEHELWCNPDAPDPGRSASHRNSKQPR